MPAPTREVFRQLLRDARITGPQLDDTVARALDRDYWRALVPGCHIESPASALEFSPADDAVIEAAVRAERLDGYFRLPGVLAPDGVRRLNAAIDAVIGAGWPPSFLFMFDEAWQSARSPAARRVVESILGPGFRQIANVWAHVVRPAAGSAGWSPHLDGDPGRRLTIWLGLTASTLDNGCMHVVPRSVTQSMADLMARFGQAHSQFSRAELTALLHATHALVTAPGDALGWGFDVIHWGGYVREGGGGRRALSFEYTAADGGPGAGDGSTVSMETLPAFEDRLRTVAAGITWYAKFEPIVERFAEVAAAIAKHLEPPG
jgi:hypothetical protein